MARFFRLWEVYNISLMARMIMTLKTPIRDEHGELTMEARAVFAEAQGLTGTYSYPKPHISESMADTTLSICRSFLGQIAGHAPDETVTLQERLLDHTWTNGLLRGEYWRVRLRDGIITNRLILFSLEPHPHVAPEEEARTASVAAAASSPAE